MSRHSLFAFILLSLSSPSWAQGPFTCQRVDLPATVRAEGATELLSDIVLRCTGGTAARAGSPVSKFQVLVTATVPLTSRILTPGATTSGMSEALLLIDEPGFNDQIGCEAQSKGDACSAIAGALNPNVFQARQIQSNSLAFRSVPIDPPGAGTRTIRITNLRANIAALETQSPPGGPVKLAVQVLDSAGTAVAVRDSDTVVAQPKSGLTFSVRTLADTPPALSGGPAITIPPASLPVGAPQSLTGFNIKFSEGFPGAFRRRNVATSSDSPLLLTVQTVPGAVYNTETGFLNTLFPKLNGMDTAGLSDTGSRLRVKFQNVPRDVLLWVSTRDVRTGTTEYSETESRAILTSADSSGGGAITPIRPSLNGLAQIPVVNGVATAVWEIVSASPLTIQEISFSIFISGQTASPGQGTVTAAGTLSPIESPGAVSIPSFKDSGKPISAFSVSNLITVPALRCVSAGSYIGTDAAPGSIVAAFGPNLSAQLQAASSNNLPLSLGGIAVEVIDSVGVKRIAPLFFVSPSQVNFLLDSETGTGAALVNVVNAGRLVASGYLLVETVAPALFSADGSGKGALAGEAIVTSGARSSTQPVAFYDYSGSGWKTQPVDSGGDGDLLYLTLYSTGVKNRRSITELQATVGGVSVPVTFAGPQGYFPGLDQVNIGPILKQLKGILEVAISVRERKSNLVLVEIR